MLDVVNSLPGVVLGDLWQMSRYRPPLICDGGKPLGLQDIAASGVVRGEHEAESFHTGLVFPEVEALQVVADADSDIGFRVGQVEMAKVQSLRRFDCGCWHHLHDAFGTNGRNRQRIKVGLGQALGLEPAPVDILAEKLQAVPLEKRVVFAAEWSHIAPVCLVRSTLEGLRQSGIPWPRR